MSKEEGSREVTKRGRGQQRERKRESLEREKSGGVKRSEGGGEGTGEREGGRESEIDRERSDLVTKYFSQISYPV